MSAFCSAKASARRSANPCGAAIFCTTIPTLWESNFSLKRFLVPKKGIVRGIGSTTLMTCQGRSSEEHTSELQSLMRNSYDAFCLKQQNYNCTHHTQPAFTPIHSNSI